MTFGIGDAVAAGLKVIDKFIPDPAANENIFVSGWRPALGWTCAFAFAFIYVLGPMITWLSTMAGNPIPLPSFNVDALMGLTLGMLGLGGLRTYEKVKGVARYTSNCALSPLIPRLWYNLGLLNRMRYGKQLARNLSL